LLQYYFYLSLFILLFFSACSTTDTEKTNSNFPEIMELTGKFDTIEDGFAKFTLTARRIKAVDDEYLPSSENFRVEIFSEKGQMVWNSSKGQNFFMVISDLEPKKEGDSKTYEIIWNFNNNDNKKVKLGKYFAYLIIPSKPENYKCRIEFEIN